MTGLEIMAVAVVVILFAVIPKPKRPSVLNSKNVIALSVYPQSPSKLLQEAAKYAHPMIKGPGVVTTKAAPVPAMPVAPILAPPVYFKSGEPRTLQEYDAQPAIVADLRDAIAAMGRDGTLAIDPQLFLGPPGMGKTLLAKVLANELGVPFFEVFPADVPDVERLDEIVRRAHQNPGCIVLIDEIHAFSAAHVLKLYLLLEEHRYQFKGDPFPTKLEPFTLVGATTDFGLMPPALRRRWVNHHFVRATSKQLVGYISRRGFPIDAKAAELVVSRTHWSGAPWEALRLYQLAVTRSKARTGKRVVVTDVEEILNRHKIDTLGLGELERSVIKALLTQPKTKAVGGVPTITHYAASEDALCNMVQLDKAGYRADVKPKLLNRGLLVMRTGQALTDKAVGLYAD